MAEALERRVCNLHIQDMRQPSSVLLIVFLAVASLAGEEKQPPQLSKQEVQLLDDFLELKPGLTEDEMRRRMPELSVNYKDKDTRKLTAATSTFRLAGMVWQGRISLVDGRVQKAELHASAWKEAQPKATELLTRQLNTRFKQRNEYAWPGSRNEHVLGF